MIKALEIKTSVLLNLDFANNTIMLLFLFLNYELILLISAVIAQIFKPTAELVLPIGISSKETKEEIEKHLVIPKS